MSTEKKTKSIAAQRAAAIEAIRTADGFLPKYSDFYYEKKKQPPALKFVIGYVIVSISLNTILNNFNTQIFKVLFGIVWALVLYHFLIKMPIRNRRKKCGTRFDEHGIVKVAFFGEKEPIPYLETEQAVISGDIHYEDTGLRIGHGSKKLIFHYEIGDSKAQKHIEECYALLQKHLTVKLPPFDKNALDLLDRKYFYEKSRRNNTISLIIALILFLIFYASGAQYTSGKLLLAAFFCPWECIALFGLCKSARLSERNHMLLKKAFEEHPRAKYGWRFAGYIHFGIAAVFAMIANYLIIYIF